MHYDGIGCILHQITTLIFEHVLKIIGRVNHYINLNINNHYFT